MALFHATQALLAQGGAARLARRRTKGFESGDMTRKMAETSRGATVRNVPGTRSEARRSERSVTFVTLGGSSDPLEPPRAPGRGGCVAATRGVNMRLVRAGAPRA